MITKNVPFILISVLVLSVSGENRAKWMQDRGWGVMTHYLADWKKQDNNLNMTLPC